ncbi:hypothetical protein KUTeg_013428 [Tegillarca granosa]|uniref:Uncharacterized protein n=1 Tax=Tegillarca granosa TaxID=220873 RepID=A0ABQ9ETN0_TEGGR|nr:hypothetical protein KUTeg_013428 [Tegillarca granosa]
MSKWKYSTFEFLYKPSNILCVSNLLLADSELESVKALFNEKEKELALAVSKVDQLTQQLEEIKKEKSNITNGDKQNATALELDKLRRELMLRNKLNEQQNSKLIVHRDMLNQRKDEMSKMDKRIQELQQRLKKKKAQQAELKKNLSNQKLDNKMPGRPAGTNIAAVEPYIQHVPKENTNDDTNKPGFAKFNPKYQSLPSNARVTNPDKSTTVEKNDKSKNSEQNNNKENYQIPLVVKVDSSNGKTIQNGVSPSELSESLKKAAQRHQNNSSENSNNELSRKTPPPLPVRSGTTTLTHLAPRPFGSTYSTSVLTNRNQEQNVAPNVNIHEDVRTGGSGQSSPASSDSSQKDGNINGFLNKNHNHSSEQSQFNIPNSVSNNKNNEKHVNGANSRSSRPGQQKHPPSPQTNENSNLSSNKSQGAPQNAFGHSNIPHDEVDSSHPIKGPVESGPKMKHPVANNNQLPSYENAVKDRNINLSPPTSGDNSKQNLNISDASTSSSNSDTSNGSKKTPTVRYASKNVIANTYMGKLGPEALAKYQSLNMLYKNFPPSSVDGPISGKHDTKNDVSSDSSQSLSPPDYNSRNDHTSSQPSYSRKIPPCWQAGGVPTSPLDIQHPDIPSDKVSHNHQKTPKTLRRRHSDSDNEDISKLIHKYVDRHSPKKHEGGHFQRLNGQDTQATSFKDQIPEKVLVDDMGNLMDIPENVENSELDNSNDNVFSDKNRIPTVQSDNTSVVLRKKKTNLRTERSVSSGNRVSFDPLALLLDASLEGELELVKKCATQVENVSESNDEGITALHNAICAGHYDIVTFLVEFGCDANSPDSDGWTPLHCAASCNNLPMVKFLVEHGACIFATTISDHETAAEKCEEDEDGFDGCSEYLYSKLY